jgi:hypothetical protein
LSNKTIKNKNTNDALKKGAATNFFWPLASQAILAKITIFRHAGGQARIFTAALYASQTPNHATWQALFTRRFTKKDTGLKLGKSSPTKTCLIARSPIFVTVSHYPPGTSKWNSTEHRLFSDISKNWQGQPLKSYETILNYIKTTTTKTGLKVKATLVNQKYSKGIRITKKEFSELAIKCHSTLPKWNYTISPREM